MKLIRERLTCFIGSMSYPPPTSAPRHATGLQPPSADIGWRKWIEWLKKSIQSHTSEPSSGTADVASIPGGVLALRPLLETMCSVLGAKNAWLVLRHGDQQKAILSVHPDAEVEQKVAERVAEQARTQPAFQHCQTSFAGGSLISSDLMAASQDGHEFLLGIWVDGPVEFTSTHWGVLEGFRCSLHALAAHLPPLTVTRRSPALTDMVVACACCDRVEGPEDSHWMDWKDALHLQHHKQISHTICQECALKLYNFNPEECDPSAKQSDTKPVV